MTDLRQQQEFVETLDTSTADLRLQQIFVETLDQLQSTPPDLRLQQIFVETLDLIPRSGSCAATYAQFFVITRQDGTVKRFVVLDKDVTWRGNTYKACGSGDPTAVEAGTGTGAANMQIAGIVDSTDITAAELQAGIYDHATIEIFLADYTDGTYIPEYLHVGQLGSVSTALLGYQAEILTPGTALQQKLGTSYTPECRWTLGQNYGVSGKPGCKVNLAALTVSTSITSVTDRRSFGASGLAQATGYFDAGTMTVTSGNNAGLVREVKRFFSGGSLEVWEMFPYTFTVGDTFTIAPGCDKTRATCISKFSNILNFGGFPDLPGIDRLNKTPDAKL